MEIKDQMIELLKSNEKIKRYKELEIQVNNDESISKLIDDMKTIQKQIVHAEKLEKKDMLNALKEKYETINNELYDYPLMSEYLDLQQEVNDLIQAIKEVIESSLAEDILLK